MNPRHGVFLKGDTQLFKCRVVLSSRSVYHAELYHRVKRPRVQLARSPCLCDRFFAATGLGEELRTHSMGLSRVLIEPQSASELVLACRPLPTESIQNGSEHRVRLVEHVVQFDRTTS